MIKKTKKKAKTMNKTENNGLILIKNQQFLIDTM